MEEAKRKGARSTKEIPANILIQLNNGEIETVNLVEWLAIDQRLLLNAVLKKFKKEKYLTAILKSIDNLKKQTVNTINEAIGLEFLQQSLVHKDAEILKQLATHKSDAVRCWATYTIGRNEKLSLQQKLNQIKPFAADTHFGVREIAWIAVRPTISKNIEEAIALLSVWTKDKNENIRRFASEATRPRGVWCEHIDALKKNPAMAVTILSPLKNDPAKYVQDSVGNWLNDASKTDAEFVQKICKQWTKESPTKETAYIVKKALRTLEK
jgi:3-methyladenine DNA glycosylase AlkC